MLKSIHITAGERRRVGRSKEIEFVARPDGWDLQVVVTFDNGSCIGYSTIGELSDYINLTMREYKEMPDTANY